MTDTRDFKKCSGCQIIKPTDDYYKSTKYLQTLCRICHNQSRKKYKINRPKYIKKLTGFNALSQETQDDIFYMIAIKYKITEICKKYKLNYKTYLGWRRNNSIPPIPEYIKNKVINECYVAPTPDTT